MLCVFGHRGSVVAPTGSSWRPRLGPADCSLPPQPIDPAQCGPASCPAVRVLGLPGDGVVVVGVTQGPYGGPALGRAAAGTTNQTNHSLDPC